MSPFSLSDDELDWESAIFPRMFSSSADEVFKISMFGNSLSAPLQRPQFIRSVQILLMLGIFWKPTFYPNHRARNPHPGDGLDPLLGPRIFRALRLGPFEGFPDGIARRLARRLPPQSGSHPKAGSLGTMFS